MNTSSSQERDAAKKTLLLVDDTPENLAVLGEILMPSYRVRVASSGARALAAAISEPRPDLILLDIMMPGMDGYEVIRRLKEDARTGDIPVIFVTALGDVEDETRGLDLGAVDYITKPVRPAIVQARVRGQLDIKEARDRMRAQNEWLEHEVERRMRQNRMISDVSLRALASLAEARDNETGNHILRTQGYVRILGEELAKSAEFADALTPALVETYAKAAPLHDIGKVAIPDNVLHKAGKLNEAEWTVMKTHAREGGDAIWRAIQNEDDRAGLDFLYVGMEIAHYHHEKWDGSGYPEGLAGEAIPLPARIMALSDVFDALISKRVYKPAFGMDETLRIITESRGSHFDPRIVDAFLRRLDDFTAIAARYSDASSPAG